MNKSKHTRERLIEQLKARILSLRDAKPTKIPKPNYVNLRSEYYSSAWGGVGGTYPRNKSKHYSRNATSHSKYMDEVGEAWDKYILLVKERECCKLALTDILSNANTFRIKHKSEQSENYIENLNRLNNIKGWEGFYNDYQMLSADDYFDYKESGSLLLSEAIRYIEKNLKKKDSFYVKMKIANDIIRKTYRLNGKTQFSLKTYEAYGKVDEYIELLKILTDNKFPILKEHKTSKSTKYISIDYVSNDERIFDIVRNTKIKQIKDLCAVFNEMLDNCITKISYYILPNEKIYHSYLYCNLAVFCGIISGFRISPMQSYHSIRVWNNKDNISYGYSINEPIEVEGIANGYKYLSRLRTNDGHSITPKRIGHISNDQKKIVDIYQILNGRMQVMTTLYLTVYSNFTSEKSPDGFSLEKIHGLNNEDEGVV